MVQEAVGVACGKVPIAEGDPDEAIIELARRGNLGQEEAKAVFRLWAEQAEEFDYLDDVDDEHPGGLRAKPGGLKTLTPSLWLGVDGGRS